MDVLEMARGVVVDLARRTSSDEVVVAGFDAHRYNALL
jgi:hypothetical protein